MKLILKIYLILILFISCNIFSKDELESNIFDFEQHLDMSALYFGLKKGNWPINYLYSINQELIDKDITYIKNMGFNTITILLNQDDFEDTKTKDLVQENLRRIYLSVIQNNMKLYIRFSYPHSMFFNSNSRIEKLVSGDVKEKKKFKKYINSIIPSLGSNEKNNNIVLFASWEDFYGVIDDFFDAQSGQYIRNVFEKETGIKASQILKNGIGYDLFLNFLDMKIKELINITDNKIGYEVRIDSDPIKNNNDIQWHSHSDFFNTPTGDIFTYWAPYYGQLNNGEMISSKKALSSFNFMLDQISNQIDKKPIIHQLNFIDTTNNTDHLAKILESDINNFFDSLPAIIHSRTKGYGIWATKNYFHDLIVNPMLLNFSKSDNQIFGWEKSKKVSRNENFVKLKNNDYIKQYIPKHRYKFADSDFGLLVIEVVSGFGKIYLNGNYFMDLAPGLNQYKILLESFPNGFEIMIKGNVSLSGVYLRGNHQSVGIHNDDGRPQQHFMKIVNLNRHLKKLLDDKCASYDHSKFINIYQIGIYKDNWTDASYSSLCVNDNLNKLETKGISLELFNPFNDSIWMYYATNTQSMNKVVLSPGRNNLTFCDLPFSKINFKIKKNIKLNDSQDLRNLGVILSEAKKTICR